jgi:hypothetical protein
MPRRAARAHFTTKLTKDTKFRTHLSHMREAPIFFFVSSLVSLVNLVVK